MALLSLGQLQRIQLNNQVAVYAHDILLGVWCVSAIIFDHHFYKWLLNFFSFKKDRFWIPLIFLLWMLIGIGAAFLRHDLILAAILYLLRLGLYGAFALLLMSYVQQKILTASQILWGICGESILIAYFGFLQYFLIPDTRWLYFLGWDDHYYRLISTIFDPGFTGLILLLGILVAQVALSSKWQLKMVATFFLEVALLLTYSRASYLALISVGVLAVAYFWHHQNRSQIKMIIVNGLVFGCGFLLLPHPGGEGVRLDRTSTITARTSQVTAVLASMKPVDWLIGKGLFVTGQTTAQRVAVYDQPNHAHIADNWLVFIFSGTGVIGGFIFLFCLGQVLVNFWQRNVWLGLALIAVLIHSLFNASLVYPFVVIFLACLNAGISKIKRQTA
jgi:hypothetical protein